MLKHFIIFLVLSTSIMSAEAQQSIYSQFDIVATSESVSIDDMENGWDGSYRSGTLAFADATFSIGFSSDVNVANHYFGRVKVERVQRAYYYMRFDKETSDFYRSLELDRDLTSDKQLDLKVKQFDGLGLSAGVTFPKFNIKGFELEAGLSLAYYKIGSFQFGSIQGIAEVGDTQAASAIIDYRYNDDKILDHQADVDNGDGISVNAELLITYEQWQGFLEFNDVVNRFQWNNAAYTKGCVNIGGGSQAQCQADGAGSGISFQDILIERIPMTANARLTHLGWDISVHSMRHGNFYRLGIEKGQQTSLGRFALFLYHPQLVGGSWQTDFFKFQLGADTLKLSKTRNIQLNMGVNWHW